MQTLNNQSSGLAKNVFPYHAVWNAGALDGVQGDTRNEKFRLRQPSFQTFKPMNEEAWMDMLSRVGSRLCQLEILVETQSKRSQPQSRRISMLSELEKERARIGRELHAGAGQPLSGIKLNLEILLNQAANFPEAAQQAILRLELLADEALQQVRAVSHRLHPPAWQDLPAAVAIRKLIDTSGLDGHFSISAQVDDLAVEPSHSVKIALYRCTQECLSNIVRHSGASAIQISLAGDETRIHLEIADNGHGIVHQFESSGIGLRALEEHATSLGGTCDVKSGLEGTTISIIIPLGEDE